MQQLTITPTSRMAFAMTHWKKNPSPMSNFFTGTKFVPKKVPDTAMAMKPAVGVSMKGGADMVLFAEIFMVASMIKVG